MSDTPVSFSLFSHESEASWIKVKLVCHWECKDSHLRIKLRHLNGMTSTNMHVLQYAGLHRPFSHGYLKDILWVLGYNSFYVNIGIAFNVYVQLHIFIIYVNKDNLDYFEQHQSKVDV